MMNKVRSVTLGEVEELLRKIKMLKYDTNLIVFYAAIFYIALV